MRSLWPAAFAFEQTLRMRSRARVWAETALSSWSSEAPWLQWRQQRLLLSSANTASMSSFVERGVLACSVCNWVNTVRMSSFVERGVWACSVASKHCENEKLRRARSLGLQCLQLCTTIANSFLSVCYREQTLWAAVESWLAACSAAFDRLEQTLCIKLRMMQMSSSNRWKIGIIWNILFWQRNEIIPFLESSWNRMEYSILET